jgi:hypothetical protein
MLPIIEILILLLVNLLLTQTALQLVMFLSIQTQTLQLIGTLHLLVKTLHLLVRVLLLLVSVLLLLVRVLLLLVRVLLLLVRVLYLLLVSPLLEISLVVLASQLVRPSCNTTVTV